MFVMGLEMNTLRILTQQDSSFVGRLGQEFRKHIRANFCGGSWSKYIKAISRELVHISENVQSTCSNVFSAFLTNSLHCVLDELRTPSINSTHRGLSMYVTCSSSEITNNCSQNDNSFLL